MNESLRQFLDNKGCYFRANPEAITASLSELGVSPSQSFVEFYQRYEGPFGSDFTGFTLSEMVGQSTASIIGATEFFRASENLFKHEHLIISDMVGDGMLVYDCLTDHVYRVDFEGGLDRLKQGALHPSWRTFGVFLDFFFLGVGADE